MQKFRVLSLKNGVAFGALCGKRAKITASPRNYLVSVKIRFWALKMTQTLVLRSQFFEQMREPLCKQALEHLEASRPDKKSFFLRERLTVIHLIYLFI